jgi:hypothetical protein
VAIPLRPEVVKRQVCPPFVRDCGDKKAQTNPTEISEGRQFYWECLGLVSCPHSSSATLNQRVRSSSLRRPTKYFCRGEKAALSSERLNRIEVVPTPKPGKVWRNPAWPQTKIEAGRVIASTALRTWKHRGNRQQKRLDLLKEFKAGQISNLRVAAVRLSVANAEMGFFTSHRQNSVTLVAPSN